MRLLTQLGLISLFFAILTVNVCAQSSAITGSVITTVAGNGTYGFSGDGGPATSAQLGLSVTAGSGTPTNFTVGIAVDAWGNLYIADRENNRIRKVTQAGVISTVAGNGTQVFSGDGRQATLAGVTSPTDIAFDASGNLYIGTGDARVRKVEMGTGVISTVAGNGINGFSGDGGPATSAQLGEHTGITFDASGNLYIAALDNNRVRKVTPGGVISTVAGNGTYGFSGDGGPATSAKLESASDLAVDAWGNLYISSFNRVRKVTPAGVISTVAGTEFRHALSIALDAAGNLYATSFDNEILIITPAGFISAVAGNGSRGFSGDGGSATTAQLSSPAGIALDSARNLYIVDWANNRVRKVENIPVTTFFPQVAVGGGFSTIFTFTNTGATGAYGSLILTDQQGEPFRVNGTLTDSLGTMQIGFVDSSFVFTVPAGGTVFLSANALNPNNPIKTGWAQLENTGGLLTGVATYEYLVGGIMQYMVGVLQGSPLQYATISVDNDNSQYKQMAYAIANPSSQTVSVRVALVGQDGVVLDDTLTVTLGPGQQIARYLWQDLARAEFKGSLVLRGQAGASFIAVALLEKQGLFTVIPLIPGKAPGIPN
jgi:hypothetical protein